MAVFLVLVILGAVSITVSEAVRRRWDRKGWTCAIEYDRDVHGLENILVRYISDPDRNTFIVRFNPLDGYFYDEEEFGYLPSELLIKDKEDEREAEI
jgi:hypothetical protein